MNSKSFFKGTFAWATKFIHFYIQMDKLFVMWKRNRQTCTRCEVHSRACRERFGTLEHWSTWCAHVTHTSTRKIYTLSAYSVGSEAVARLDAHFLQPKPRFKSLVGQLWGTLGVPSSGTPRSATVALRSVCSWQLTSMLLCAVFFFANSLELPPPLTDPGFFAWYTQKVHLVLSYMTLCFSFLLIAHKASVRAIKSRVPKNAVHDFQRCLQHALKQQKKNSKSFQETKITLATCDHNSYTQ